MRTYTAFFPFCGSGGGALGCAHAAAEVLGEHVSFRVLGGIDNDPLACRDFEALCAAPALCADVASLTPAELRAFAGRAAPDMVFLSPPCKGHTALISAKKRKEAKYQRMNTLGLDWVRLMLETWREPPKLVLFENVPRVTTHGRDFLADIKTLLAAHGYVFHGGYHECGELGGLAQLRRRFLLVARHAASVPPLLYQPPRLRVRGCGEVLEALPLPARDGAGGRMHRMPRISWRNWIRLALIPAGGDWRDLPGVLGVGQPRREQFRRYRVTGWTEPSPTVGGVGTNGSYGVGDPRVRGAYDHGYAVLRWEQPSYTVAGGSHPGQGAYSVGDPRVEAAVGELGAGAKLHAGGSFETYGITPWDAPARTVTGESRPSNGRFSIADPRVELIPQARNPNLHWSKYQVRGWEEPAKTVTSAMRVGSGAPSVADPRVAAMFTLEDVACPRQRPGAYGVLEWRGSSRTVTGAAKLDNGTWSVADPRLPPGSPSYDVEDLDAKPEAPPVIVSQDGTWHRPLTTLELAVLQGFPPFIDGKPLELGGSLTSCRERIGNAVPPPAAKALAEQMLVTLACADAGAQRLDGDLDVWVDPRDHLSSTDVDTWPLCGHSGSA